MSKITGTVKWFSNKKGFGFLSPTSDNSPTTEEIFVHQTNIFSDGSYRTLVEGAEVEFDVEKEDGSGKFKAVNVTGPGGASLKPPPRDKRRQKPKADDQKQEEQKEEQKDDRGGRKQAPKESSAARPKREPPFHESMTAEVKDSVTKKGIELGQRTTVDLAVGGSRIKLGQGGYAGLADASGLIGEGSYTADKDGKIVFAWERSLEFSAGQWSAGDTSRLVSTISLTDDNIAPVKPDETPEALWGTEKTDPKEAFEKNGFKMKKVVLARPAGAGRGRRGDAQ